MATKTVSAGTVTIILMRAGHLPAKKFGDGGNSFIRVMPGSTILGCQGAKGYYLGSRRTVERQLRSHVGCSFPHAFPAGKRQNCAPRSALAFQGPRTCKR